MKTAWKKLDIRYTAVIASLLLSSFSTLTASLPNDDAYTYIRTAEIFLDDGVSAAISHYTWAGYPILIGAASMFGLSLLEAAYALNAIFYSMLVFSYISIVQRIDNARIIALLGAITVLAYPELNEYRDMIIRDTGYWSLSLFAIWRFILFSDSRQFSELVTFVIAMFTAALFRAEALVYVLAIPLVLLLDTKLPASQNRLDVLKVIGFTVTLLSSVILIALIVGINIPIMLIKLVSVYEPFLIGLFNPSDAILATQANTIFGPFSQLIPPDYLHAAVLLGLPAVLITSLFFTIGGPYFWLLSFGALRGMLQFEVEQVRPLLSVALVNLFIAVGFLYLTKFFTGRYAMMLGIMVSMMVPILLKSMLARFRISEGMRAVHILLILLVSYCMIDAYVSFGRPKDWLVDSAVFAKIATPKEARILTNNHTIAYLSERVSEYDRVSRELQEVDIKTVPPGTLIVLELTSEIRQLVNHEEIQAQLKLLATFPNSLEPRAVIYERKSSPDEILLD